MTTDLCHSTEHSLSVGTRKCLRSTPPSEEPESNGADGTPPEDSDLNSPLAKDLPYDDAGPTRR